MKRRATVVVIAAIVVVPVALVLAVQVARWTDRWQVPGRVWAFVPAPAWSEDPPAHVATEPDASALPRDVWSIVPVTQSRDGATIMVVRSPSRTWRRFADVLHLPVTLDTYVPTGEERAGGGGGRWIECAR